MVVSAPSYPLGLRVVFDEDHAGVRVGRLGRVSRVYSSARIVEVTCDPAGVNTVVLDVPVAKLARHPEP